MKKFYMLLILFVIAFANPTLSQTPDQDMDGIPDQNDLCPNTPIGILVGPDGCPLQQEFTIYDLPGFIENLDLINGIKISLVKKAHNAISSFDDGNTETAVDKLNVMISEIEALAGKKIPQQNALTLVNIIRDIISDLTIIDCSIDGVNSFEATIKECRAMGGSVGCAPNIPGWMNHMWDKSLFDEFGPPPASTFEVFEVYFPITVEVVGDDEWIIHEDIDIAEWFINLIIDVRGTKIADRDYVEDSYECDAFADDLEKALTAKGYDATFTYRWCRDEQGNWPVEGHALTDVHAPNGEIVFIDPQNGQVEDLDSDGDGYVMTTTEYHRPKSQWVPTEGNCRIEVHPDRESWMRAGGTKRPE